MMAQGYRTTLPIKQDENSSRTDRTDAEAMLRVPGLNTATHSGVLDRDPLCLPPKCEKSDHDRRQGNGNKRFT